MINKPYNMWKPSFPLLIIEDESIIVCWVGGMGLAMQSTMTYVVLRCVRNGMCNEWEDTGHSTQICTIFIKHSDIFSVSNYSVNWTSP